MAGGDQVARPPVERHVELGIGKARARDDRLVVAGQETLGLAQAGDPHRPEIVLEEGARLGGLRGANAGRPPANLRQRDVDRAGVARTLGARGTAGS